MHHVNAVDITQFCCFNGIGVYAEQHKIHLIVTHDSHLIFRNSLLIFLWSLCKRPGVTIDWLDFCHWSRYFVRLGLFRPLDWLSNHVTCFLLVVMTIWLVYLLNCLVMFVLSFFRKLLLITYRLVVLWSCCKSEFHEKFSSCIVLSRLVALPDGDLNKIMWLHYYL